MPSLKGSAWLVNFDYIKENFGGQAALEKVLDKLDPEDAQTLKKPMVASSWGPSFNHYMRFILAADKVLGKGDLNLLPQACAYHFKRDTQLYSFFFKVLSTKLVFKATPKIWGTYFKPSGEWKVIDVDDRHMQIQLSGFEEMPLQHEVYHSKYLEEICRLTNASNYKVNHPKCTAKGDDHCLWDIKWE